MGTPRTRKLELRAVFLFSSGRETQRGTQVRVGRRVKRRDCLQKVELLCRTLAGIRRKMNTFQKRVPVPYETVSRTSIP